jgi:hypothetical protein
MNQPLIGTRREAMPLDLMRANVQEDVLSDALKGLFDADQVGKFFHPPNALDEFIYGLSRTAQGREFFEWILDGTLRAPYRPIGKDLQETALNAAMRQGLNIPADMILAAISRGEQAIAARTPGAKQ